MSSQTNPLVSIIINNYNYDRFLSAAIDSALTQTYQNIEIVVVDDGSTDRSREIIASYGDRIVPVLTENGGQAAALNTGIDKSTGEFIFFLDADDIFLPNKVATILELLQPLVAQEPDTMVSNYVETIDERDVAIDLNIVDTLSHLCDWHRLPEIGGSQSGVFDARGLSRLSDAEGVYRFVAKYRFIPYLGMPTSGLTMTRSLATKIFPLPSGSLKISADDFIVKAASTIGFVYLTNRVLTRYRIHGNNNWYGKFKSIPPEFFEVLDRFLNSKLELIGRRPVFSYFSSTHAKGYYRAQLGNDCERELFDLAFRVISWRIDPTTIVFFCKTIALSLILKFKQIGYRYRSIEL